MSYEGDPLRILFNGHYVVDLLARIRTERVRVTMRTNLSPALIQGDVAEPDHLYLCMPLRDV